MPGDGPQDDLAVLDPDQDLGRAAHDVDVVTVEIVQVGSGIERAEVPVGEERVGGRQVEPPRQHGLKGVSGRDVLLDPSHIVLEPLVRVWRRGLRAGLGQLERKRADGHRPRQTAEPVLDAHLCLLEQAPQLRLRCARRDLDVGDHRGPVVHVVEDQQGVGDHQNRIRKVPIVRWRRRQRLDRAYDIVAQVSDGPPGEAGEAGDLDRGVLSHGAAKVVQRRHVPLGQLPTCGRRPAFAETAAVAEDLARVGCQKGVAGPTLSALERFEQETVRSPVDLAERRDRCVAVEDDLARYRDDAGGALRSTDECCKPVAHLGAPTT